MRCLQASFYLADKVFDGLDSRDELRLNLCDIVCMVIITYFLVNIEVERHHSEQKQHGNSVLMGLFLPRK